MSALLRLLYDGTAALASAASAIAPASDHKALRALRERRGLRSRYAAWARSSRDQARPLLWVHAPSVGEGLQARPVLALVRRNARQVQLAYTFFSPSAERFAAGLDVDFRDYLPFDARADVRHALRTLAPTALVFSKLDVWPNLVREAHRTGIRLGLISATLAAGSRRRGRIADALLRSAYAQLDAVGAIDAEDAERLLSLGVRREALTVTGDTRYDQVWERAAAIAGDEATLAPLRSSAPTLVAGSTWPADERELLPAWGIVRARIPGARLIIAPHEPTPAHLSAIERWATEQRIPATRLTRPDPDAPVVIVDRVGVLGALYALADAAFIGGGFHGAGLHSVLEPAAFGAPVSYGPRHRNSRDAIRLNGRGGRVVRNRDDLAETLILWFSNEQARRTAGAAARALVESGRGAAERSWGLVSGLLRDR